MSGRLEPFPWRRFIYVMLPPLLLGGVAALCCYIVAGPTLMLFLGCAALAMVLTPPLVLAQRARLDQWLAAASLTDGVAVVWLVAALASETTLWQWLGAYLLLASCVFGTMGVAAALSRFFTRQTLPAAMAVAMVVAWLTWPIWISTITHAAAATHAVRWLVPAHPLLALNGLLVHLGVWGELPLMYRLTSLGQDIPYSLPSSVAVAGGAHLLLGMALLLLSGRRDVSAAVDEPD